MRTRIATIGILGGGALMAIAATAGPAWAGGVSGPAFYIDGQLYRTVATPTDLSGTGAPDHSFDTIYSFNGAQPSVATAAPGDPDFNGGRWQVHSVTFAPNYSAALASADTNGNGVIDSDAELAVAFADGTAVDNGVIRMFVCTVNKVPASQH